MNGLVKISNNSTIKQAKKEIKKLYPHADEDIFSFIEIEASSKDFADLNIN